jgi:hypothetical protein
MLFRQNSIADINSLQAPSASSSSSSSSSVPVNLSEVRKRVPLQLMTETGSTPQSVKEVLINSIAKQQTAYKQNNIAHDIASTLESAGPPFHAQNPEGSMIKELLLKTREQQQQQQQQQLNTRLKGLMPVIPAALSVSISNNVATTSTVAARSPPKRNAGAELLFAQQSPILNATVQIQPSASPTSAKPTHIIYADPTRPGAAVTLAPVPLPVQAEPKLVRCTLCSSTFPAKDLEVHRKYYCQQQQRTREHQMHGQPMSPKRMRFGDETPSTSTRMFYGGGGIVTNSRTVASSAGAIQGRSAGGLLQIAQTGLQAGGGVVSLIKQPQLPGSTGTSISVDNIQSFIPTSTFAIPGVPAPSLSGVLTGIKQSPLFSLQGKRSSSEDSGVAPSNNHVPFVHGMPGPYSQPSETPTTPTIAKSFSSRTQSQVPKTVESPLLPEVKKHSSSSPGPVNLSKIPEITVSPAPPGQIKVEVSSACSSPAADGTFLRPSSLSLTPGSFRQKKHVMATPTGTGGASLVSPDTPRPRKSCALTYQNGTAYTHLGLKCSTRSYYCCIFRPQPVYVQNKPRLSMYSNWKMVGKDSHPSGLAPKDSLASYNSGYKEVGRGAGCYTIASSSSSKTSCGDMIVAHSSQWKPEAARKAREEEEERKKKKEEEERAAADLVIGAAPTKSSVLASTTSNVENGPVAGPSSADSDDDVDEDDEVINMQVYINKVPNLAVFASNIIFLINNFSGLCPVPASTHLRWLWQRCSPSDRGRIQDQRRRRLHIRAGSGARTLRLQELRHPLQEALHAQEAHPDAQQLPAVHVQALQLFLQDQGEPYKTHEVQDTPQKVR